MTTVFTREEVMAIMKEGAIKASEAQDAISSLLTLMLGAADYSERMKAFTEPTYTFSEINKQLHTFPEVLLKKLSEQFEKDHPGPEGVIAMLRSTIILGEITTKQIDLLVSRAVDKACKV